MRKLVTSIHLCFGFSPLVVLLPLVLFLMSCCVRVSIPPPYTYLTLTLKIMFPSTSSCSGVVQWLTLPLPFRASTGNSTVLTETWRGRFRSQMVVYGRVHHCLRSLWIRFKLIHMQVKTDGAPYVIALVVVW